MGFALKSWGLHTAKALAMTPSRLVAAAAAKHKRRYCRTGPRTVLLESSRVENFSKNGSAIRLGSNTVVGGQLLVFAHGGRINIGDNCFVGEGARVWSANSIEIGNRVLISHDVNIHDTNSHSLSAQLRHEHIMTMFESGHPKHLPDVTDAPVIIEDDVWIGFNAVVLKGVRLGRGCVVGSASVVTKNVDPYSVVAGNPARKVGSARH